MEYLLGRQYKDRKPAQQALRQPQTPHYAGLFADLDLRHRPGDNSNGKLRTMTTAAAP